MAFNEKVIFVENYIKNYNYLNAYVVALNAEASFELSENIIQHYNVSDFIIFKDYLKHSHEYLKVQKHFFEECDQHYKSLKTELDFSFAPFHILGFSLNLVFDSLFSQLIILSTIIRRIKVSNIVLLTSFHASDKTINYIENNEINYYDYLLLIIKKKFIINKINK